MRAVALAGLIFSGVSLVPLFSYILNTWLVRYLFSIKLVILDWITEHCPRSNSLAPQDQSECLWAVSFSLVWELLAGQLYTEYQDGRTDVQIGLKKRGKYIRSGKCFCQGWWLKK